MGSLTCDVVPDGGHSILHVSLWVGMAVGLHVLQRELISLHQIEPGAMHIQHRTHVQIPAHMRFPFSSRSHSIRTQVHQNFAACKLSMSNSCDFSKSFTEC